MKLFCPSKRGLIASIFLLLSAWVVQAADPIDLRGYGKVSADLSPHRGVFRCESVEKADLLLDKLQADLFWDTNFPVEEKDLTVGTSTVTIYSVAGGYGSALIARSDKNVLVLGAADEKEAAAAAAKEPLLRARDVTSHAAKPHPFSLDYFDNKAFKSYILPMKSNLGFTIESHWPFLKSFGGSEAFFGPEMWTSSPAPGVFDWTPVDYEVQEAERQHQMIVIGPEGGGPVPLWAANRFPQSMMKPSDTTLLGDWGGVPMVGSHYESWAAPLEERSQLGLGFFQKIMERYGSSPSVGGWMVFAGAPGLEYNFHGRSTHAWDTSPVGEEGWRSWLRDERHLSLSDLGTRWYGDPQHFSSWDEVDVPDINEFFGTLGPDSYRLDSGWRWQNSAAAIANQIASDSPAWVPVAMPPSQQQAFLNRAGFNSYDVIFDPSGWLGKQPGGTNIWLVFGMVGTGDGAARVWLNDVPLNVPNDEASVEGPFAIQVTGALRSGPNHLQVCLNADQSQTQTGKLAGPVFFTTHEPKRIPYLGRETNARYADFIAWQAWAMTDYHRKMIMLARKIDPDRPLVISAGWGEVYDYTIELARDYGMGVENTGREAYYDPRRPGNALAAGFYPTSEWSSTPSGFWLDRGFSWALIDGDSSHCLFHDIDDFQKREKDDGWFTRHRRQIQLFGKYLREQPQVALLQSIESEDFHATGKWDIGMGQLQSAHYDNVYITEEGLKEGLADRYPVLFDTGNLFMEPDVVDALKKYVEQGGTFVALDNTARHTALDPDSDPLAALSGFKYANLHAGADLRFQGDLPLFKGWENQRFHGWGTALKIVDENQDNDANAASAPLDRPRALALWDDGSVAVGYRKVGKGQIVTLGSTFWRDGWADDGSAKDPRVFESTFLEKLLTGCGIDRTAGATVPDVWARKMVTKNGLQSWLMAFNSSKDPVECNVWMATGDSPREVIDMENNARVAFESDGRGVTIKAVHFDPYQVRTFAVRRATLAGGLPVWWNEKTTYWKRTPAEVAAAAMTFPEPKTVVGDVIPLDQFHFLADEDKTMSDKSDWTALSFDDSSWKLAGYGPWNYFDPALKDYHGTGLYRVKFVVPTDWAGRQVLLNLANFDLPIAYDTADFSINGTHVATYQAHGWSQTYNYDVTSHVQTGDNILAVQVSGGAKLGGLAGSVWIESQKPLSPSQDLDGTWQAVHADWLSRDDVSVPGSAKAKYLTRTFAVPPQWQGRSIYLDWKTDKQWVGGIVINGHPISFNAFGHPFGPISRINVTPYLLAGTKNTVGIWPVTTMFPGTNTGESDQIEIDSISIGCE